jgi:hypothetical protein
MNLDSSDEEKLALADLLKRTIEANHYPLSPRIRRLKAILAKLGAAGRRLPRISWQYTINEIRVCETARIEIMDHNNSEGNGSLVPDPPAFTDDEIRHCRETGDFRPILFEWYKFVGCLAILLAHIQRGSLAFRPITAGHYHVLIGLLHRCARLMLSNVALSHEGRFGETTAIVDRCIFESAIKNLVASARANRRAI